MTRPNKRNSRVIGFVQNLMKHFLKKYRKCHGIIEYDIYNLVITKEREWE